MRTSKAGAARVNLRSEVITTATIPLWARAVEQSQKKPILIDRLAPQILTASGGNSDSYKGITMSQVGCCIRAMIIDRLTEKFASQHTPCIAIQLGAGLDARFQRLNHPERIATWYDLDLPESMAQRKKLIPAADRNEYLEQSLFDTAWMEELSGRGLPVIIILEGVMMYFTQEQVAGFFNDLARYFTGGAQIVLDLVPPLMVRHAKYHDAVKKAGETLEFTWTIEPNEFEKTYPRLRCAESFCLSDHDTTKRFPWIYRTACRVPRLRRLLNQKVVSLTLLPE